MSYGEPVVRQPERPRIRVIRLLVGWTVSAAAIVVAAWLVPGVALEQTGAAFLAAAGLAVLNAVLPPLLAALRLPFMIANRLRAPPARRRPLPLAGGQLAAGRGRPAVYATLSSYDEVAHHSGLQRADTLEALRKLDQQFGRLDRARRYAPRPYEIVVLSDPGQTQGATFKQRNGYGLDELVERSLRGAKVTGVAGGDEQDAVVKQAMGEAAGRAPKKRPKNDVSDRDVVVLGSGSLGLVYLMEEKRRLTLEEIEERHPELIPALRDHPHVGWLLVRSSEHGAVALGRSGTHYLEQGRVDGDDPLEHFSANAPQHLLRMDGFPDVADIMGSAASMTPRSTRAARSRS